MQKIMRVSVIITACVECYYYHPRRRTCTKILMSPAYRGNIEVATIDNPLDIKEDCPLETKWDN